MAREGLPLRTLPAVANADRLGPEGRLGELGCPMLTLLKRAESQEARQGIKQARN